MSQTLLTLLSTKTPLVVVDFFLQLPFPVRSNVCSGNLIHQLLAVARGDGIYNEKDSTNSTSNSSTNNTSTSGVSGSSGGRGNGGVSGVSMHDRLNSHTSSPNKQGVHGISFSLSIRSEALWMLGRLARTYPWRLAQEWVHVDIALRKCYRCVDPELRLHAIKVI